MMLSSKDGSNERKGDLDHAGHWKRVEPKVGSALQLMMIRAMSALCQAMGSK